MPGSLIFADDWSGFASFRKRAPTTMLIAECGAPEVAEQSLPMVHLVFSNLSPAQQHHRGVKARTIYKPTS